MKIFVVGGTGVLGRALVPLLVADQHQVVGLVRSRAKADEMTSMGGTPIFGDLFEPESLVSATEGCDVIVHAATSIPRSPKHAGDWQGNDKVRTVGTQNLLQAARLANVKLYVQQSIVFIYGDHGDDWLDEETPIAGNLPLHLHSAVEMEQIVQAQSVPWMILRGGSFYGHATTEKIFMTARQGQLMMNGDGMHFLSLIHVEDMARAIVAAIAHPSPQSTFHVVDDLPVRQHEFYHYMAELAAGSVQKQLSTGGSATSIRCKNEKLRREMQFDLKYPTYKEGLATMNLSFH